MTDYGFVQDLIAVKIKKLRDEKLTTERRIEGKPQGVTEYDRFGRITVPDPVERDQMTRSLGRLNFEIDFLEKCLGEDLNISIRHLATLESGSQEHEKITHLLSLLGISF